MENTMDAAIDEIEELRFENQRLRDAIEDVFQFSECTQGCCSCCNHLFEIRYVASKALAGK